MSEKIISRRFWLCFEKCSCSLNAFCAAVLRPIRRPFEFFITQNKFSLSFLQLMILSWKMRTNAVQFIRAGAHSTTEHSIDQCFEVESLNRVSPEELIVNSSSDGIDVVYLLSETVV